MQKVEYEYKTRIGTFHIRHENHPENPWALYIDDDYLGSYKSSKDAREAVGKGKSGYTEWDNLSNSPSNPHDLSDWDII